MNATTQHVRVAWAPVLAVAIFTVLTWPVWRWLWGEWMGNEYYSHGVLIPPVSLYLAYQRFRNDKALVWTPGMGSNTGLALTAAGLVLYLWFFNNRAFYLAAFAMILMLGGLVWTFGGNNVARRLIFPVAYLALMVPLPFIDRYTLPLAMFTGVCSGALARFLGLDVTIVGNAVTLPNADLVIGAQCSGVNSLIALTALMVLAAYLVQGPRWGRLLLVVLAVPLAILGNILRVTSLLFVARMWGAQAGFVFYHDYSGIAFFVVVLLLMLPITRLLRCNQLRPEVI
jgi:exosortase